MSYSKARGRSHTATNPSIKAINLSGPCQRPGVKGGLHAVSFS
jgi:hypothetical protein